MNTAKAYRKASADMKAAFLQSTAAAGIDAKWREEHAIDVAPASIALRYAGISDLIIASQPDPSWPQSGELDLVESLVLESGRPVLSVPNSGQHRQTDQRVVVAWNGRREAARTVFDALPALKKAQCVAIARIAPDTGEGRPHDMA
jgi:hypothetical protein